VVYFKFVYPYGARSGAVPERAHAGIPFKEMIQARYKRQKAGPEMQLEEPASEFAKVAEVQRQAAEPAGQKRKQQQPVPEIPVGAAALFIRSS